MDNVENETEWPVAFAKYLTDLQLTHLDASKDRAYIIEQLLSHAIRLEYSDNSKWSLLLWIIDVYLIFSNMNKVVKYNLIGTDADHFNQKENGKDYLESIDCKSVLE